MGIHAGIWYQGAETTQPEQAQIPQTPFTPNVAGGAHRGFLFPTPPAAATTGTAPTPQPAAVASALQNAFDKVLEKQSGDENKREFNWQATSGATHVADFREELLGTEKILAFGIVKSGSPTINVIHGLRKYYNGNVAPELRGKVLGRIGDWTTDATPYIVEMQPEATWKWEKITVATDAVAWNTFINNPQNAGQLWVPGATADPVEKDIQLPRMIYLPTVIAKYLCEGEPKTAHQMYKHLGEVVGKEGSGLTELDSTLLRMWCLAAGQVEPGKTTASSVSIKPDPVVQVSPSFQHWAKQSLMRYLGEGPAGQNQQQTSPQAAAPAMFEGQFETIMTRHTNSMLALAQTHSKSILDQAKKKEEGRTLDEYDCAALKGWCGVTDMAEIPAIWCLFKLSKSVVHARSNIVNGMKDWSKKMGIETSANILFIEEQIKDIMKMEPNPSGCVGTQKASDRGVSNMMCLPRTIQEIQDRLEKEALARETSQNRTMNEAIKLATSSLKEPPAGYYTLKLNIATLLALLFVLYGRRCTLYVKLMEVYNVLTCEAVAIINHKFTPFVCRTITWAVYDDCRSFFHRRLMPSDFTGNMINWPQSLLDDIIADVRFVRPIQRPTFPIAWDEEKYTTTRIKPPANQNTPSNTPPSGGTRNEPAGRQKEVPPGVKGDFSHMHPKLKKFFDPILKKFDGKVRISEIMQAAGVRWSDMPKYSPDATGNAQLCWDHTCGICVFGSKCNRFNFHLPGKDLNDKFVEEVIAVLMPGVQKMMADSYDRTQYQNTQSYYGRDPKRSRINY